MSEMAPPAPASPGIVYYGAFDDNDDPIGLFRKLQDDQAETLTLERMTADGTWLDDPSIIDELHEPEVRIVDSSEAATIRDVLSTVGAVASGAVAPDDPVVG